jgi:hypothetical protein
MYNQACYFNTPVANIKMKKSNPNREYLDDKVQELKRSFSTCEEIRPRSQVI